MRSDAFSINIEKLSKSFKDVQALDSISLNFPAGYMHGVIGPDGAGKTTLMRLMLGLLKPDAGEIKYINAGKEVPFLDIRSDIAYMPQQESLYADLSVDEHLEFFRDLYGIPSDVYVERRIELLNMTQLTDFVDRPAGKLSGGMYKKLGLICALLRSPSVVLLDEPTNGVDPISRREFWNLLYKLLDKNILIVLSTAYMDEAERCSYVHLIEGGKQIATGEPRQMLRQENVDSFDQLFIKRGQHDYS